ncbi:hypothetical protein [Phytopseudomonas dryadis]|uniref:Uncharacterized protein n=1 Tax=Phytopseudomonas dryadis TaxID=2487520 RepID=A0A4Q9R309_9GAMM|nr:MULTISPECIES: hypothetical protein [Pseudomonas]TBU93470.1 hypothetical protein DNK44_10840 [Pseudomonas dryadis]TBV07021.1 hypothetical protein DNK34_09345 [Pseudomonas dryadis]TBV19586.1 hypothetical protein DNK41_03370 [Pseudomonas sp. FRB 230]
MRINGWLLGLLLAASRAVACEVDTAAAFRDATHGNYVIPVRVAPGERCVILDQASEQGWQVRRTLWLPVEKLGMLSADRYGHFSREYQVDGERARIDRYVYQAGATPGEEDVIFASFPDGRERRAVAYRITVR